MSEPKPFASLSSGLLARKGAARPAMRPQGFGQIGAGLEDLGWNDMGFEPPKPAENDEDGADVVAAYPVRTPSSGLTPVESPVHDQQAAIAGRLSAYAPDDAGEEVDETAELYEPEDEPAVAFEAPVAPAPEPERVVAVASALAPVPVRRRATKVRSAPGGKAKAAFTLRLDSDRHLKLRLACAVHGSSAQMLVTDALDQFLAAMPELDAMAEKAKRKG